MLQTHALIPNFFSEGSSDAIYLRMIGFKCRRGRFTFLEQINILEHVIPLWSHLRYNRVYLHKTWIDNAFCVTEFVLNMSH